MQRKYCVLGACSGWGAKIRSCEKGPEALVEGRVFERARSLGFLLESIEMLYPIKRAEDEWMPLSSSLPVIKEFNLQVKKEVQNALKRGEFPLVFGGDHSIAVGTWNAWDEPYGLLWLDAHMDSHTMETSPSGAYHGMPLAALMGYGADELTRSMRPPSLLKPRQVALIGVRSFESGEWELLQKLNVKVYFMDEVKKRGLKAILPEAISHVSKGDLPFGVSLDLDFFSPEDAPGVGSPVPFGVRKEEFLSAVSIIRQDPKWMGFEIMEFNPELDVDHKTRELVFEILKEILQK